MTYTIEVEVTLRGRFTIHDAASPHEAKAAARDECYEHGEIVNWATTIIDVKEEE